MGSPHLANDNGINYETDVLVVGGGPIGMTTAYFLTKYGQSSMLIDQNAEPTKHPKMELFQGRAMEMYRKHGIADDLRKIGVPMKYKLDELMTTGLSFNGRQIAKWERDSPQTVHEKSIEVNDGTFPLEPYMRLSQILLEEWQRHLLDETPSIQTYWGFTFKSLVEAEDAVFSTVVDPSGNEITIKSKYVIGCDGAGSKVRLAAGLESKRASLPLNMQLVHFKSRDLTRLYSQGTFWHLMLLSGGVVVSQDEIETWTAHKMSTPDDTTDMSKVDGNQFVFDIVGGFGEPYPIKIDEVLVKSTWRADFAVADNFRSSKGRVLLAGDAAHQITPVGGHGFNSGVADAANLAWKLAAVLAGFGGDGLLASYDPERHAVALVNTKQVQSATFDIVLPMMNFAGENRQALMDPGELGDKTRRKLKELIEPGYWLHNQPRTDMGYRYSDSKLTVADREPEPEEREWDVQEYLPGTRPGSRAPHVWLKDRKTSIFDLYGDWFSIVDFEETGKGADVFGKVAASLGVPVKMVKVPGEDRARSIWERDLVLVRPDGHVAWRSGKNGSEAIGEELARTVLLKAFGREEI